MNTLLSKNTFDPQNNENLSDLFEDIDKAHEFLENHNIFENTSPHSSKRKPSTDLLELHNPPNSLKKYRKISSHSDSLSFSSKKAKFLEMELESTFHCSKHLFHPIKFFCLYDSNFLCNACRLDHLDHKSYLKSYSEKNLLAEIEKLNDKLVLSKQITKDFQTKIATITGKTMFSNEISQLFKSICVFFTTPSLNQMLKPFNKLTKIKEIFIESSLIQNTQEESFILECFPKKIDKVSLIYKASLKGFHCNDFHKFCDKKGPLLILIKSERNQVFGGYSSKSWKSKGGVFEKDENSFLFSLTKRTKHTLNEKCIEKALYFSDNMGPVFGSGFDLAISEQCNEDGESFANLGIAFECNEEMSSEEKRHYLAGDIHFKVKEIEVFNIN